MLPPTYTGAVMSGNGVIGILSSLLKIFVKVSFAKDLKLSSALYFLVAAVITASCIAAFIRLQRLEFTRFYLYKLEKVSRLV